MQKQNYPDIDFEGKQPAALKVSNGLRGVVEFVGRWASWFIVPLVLITVVDVVARSSRSTPPTARSTACRSG